MTGLGRAAFTRRGEQNGREQKENTEYSPTKPPPNALGGSESWEGEMLFEFSYRNAFRRQQRGSREVLRPNCSLSASLALNQMLNPSYGHN